MKLHRLGSAGHRIGRDQRGASIVEYAIIVGLIGLLAFVGFRKFGSSLLGAGGGQGRRPRCGIPDGNGEVPAGCQSSAGSGPLAYNGPTEVYRRLLRQWELLRRRNARRDRSRESFDRGSPRR